MNIFEINKYIHNKAEIFSKRSPNEIDLSLIDDLIERDSLNLFDVKKVKESDDNDWNKYLFSILNVSLTPFPVMDLHIGKISLHNSNIFLPSSR